MSYTRWAPATWLTWVAVVCSAAMAGPPADPLQAFWKADTVAAAERAGTAVAEGGVGFADARRALAAGRIYSARVPTGRVDRVRRGLLRVPHPYTLLVPGSYDPEVRYPVHVFLHGGVNRPAWKPGGAWWNDYGRMEDDRRISIFPAAWNESTWWQQSQTENLAAVLDAVKREFNIDENRVFLIGISDGGTGTWFQALRSPTPWAGFLSLIGHPAVLANPRSEADGDLFASNLANRPMLAINGEVDRLYPAASLAPWIDLFRSAGAEIEFVRLPGVGHEMGWLPRRKADLASWIGEHRRDPHPVRLSWETERTDLYNRVDWLVITELDSTAAVDPHADNLLTDPDRRSRSVAFPRRGPSGRVQVERDGNEFAVRTRGVRRFKLLLSPDRIDFDRPVRVVTNGTVSFDGRVERDVATLLHWAARDNDRERLYGAELEIRVTPQPAQSE